MEAKWRSLANHVHNQHTIDNDSYILNEKSCEYIFEVFRLLIKTGLADYTAGVPNLCAMLKHMIVYRYKG